MIKLENVHKRYFPGKENEIHALNDVTLTIRKGEMVAITGPSGSGKSTLLNIISLTDKCDSGKVIIDGKDVSNASDGFAAKMRNKTIGLIMQDFGLLGDLSVIKNVSLPLLIGKTPWKKASKISMETLEKLGISDLANKKTSLLSGGQQQRVAVARCLSANTPIILADEPTGALDIDNTKKLMELFRKLNASGITILIVTHDPLVAQMCKRRISIEDGKIRE